MLKKRLWLILVGILVVLGSLTVTVFAEPPKQEGPEDDVHGNAGESGVPDTVIGDDPDEVGYTGDVIQFTGGENSPSEDGDNEGVVPEWYVNSVIGDDPDEDGYTGEVFMSGEEIISSEEGISGEGLPDWGLDSMEPQPDDVESYQQGINDNGITGDLLYHYIAGASMHPRNSDTTWAYVGMGCVYAPAGDDWFILDLQLPSGSTIRYIRIYFYDENSTSSNDGRAWITRYDGSGGAVDFLNVNTSGDSGYGTVLSDYSGEVIDNYSYSYVLHYKSEAHNGTVQLCGLRIFYETP